MQRGDLRKRGDRRSVRRLWRGPRSGGSGGSGDADARSASGGALPPRFVGVWERVALEVDGAPLTDQGRAVWLEAGGGYAVLRTGNGPDCPAAAAGTTSWDGTSLRWSLEVDSHPGEGLCSSAERGHVSFDGDDLVEEGTGTDGSPVPYRARWRRLPGVGGPWAPHLVAETDRGLAVRIGMHAAVVVDRGPAGGGVVAVYCRWDGLVWRAMLTLGADVDPGDLPMLEPGAILPAGWRWRATR